MKDKERIVFDLGLRGQLIIALHWQRLRKKWNPKFGRPKEYRGGSAIETLN
jgi:hypothetical protein